MLDWLKDNIEQIGTGLSILAVMVIGTMGRIHGKKGEPPKAVELAGAVIDSTDVKSIVAALNINTASVRENSEVRREGDGRIINQLDEVNDRLEKIKDELLISRIENRR